MLNSGPDEPADMSALLIQWRQDKRTHNRVVVEAEEHEPGSIRQHTIHSGVPGFNVVAPEVAGAPSPGRLTAG